MRRSNTTIPGTSSNRHEQVSAPSSRSEVRCRDLLPLSDYGRDGAPITGTAPVCNNPECGFNIRSDNGDITFGRSVPHSKT